MQKICRDQRRLTFSSRRFAARFSRSRLRHARLCFNSRLRYNVSRLETNKIVLNWLKLLIVVQHIFRCVYFSVFQKCFIYQWIYLIPLPLFTPTCVADIGINNYFMYNSRFCGEHYIGVQEYKELQTWEWQGFVVFVISIMCKKVFKERKLDSDILTP